MQGPPILHAEPRQPSREEGVQVIKVSAFTVVLVKQLPCGSVAYVVGNSLGTPAQKSGRSRSAAFYLPDGIKILQTTD